MITILVAGVVIMPLTPPAAVIVIERALSAVKAAIAPAVAITAAMAATRATNMAICATPPMLSE